MPLPKHITLLLFTLALVIAGATAACDAAGAEETKQLYLPAVLTPTPTGGKWALWNNGTHSCQIFSVLWELMGLTNTWRLKPRLQWQSRPSPTENQPTQVGFATVAANSFAQNDKTP